MGSYRQSSDDRHRKKSLYLLGRIRGFSLLGLSGRTRFTRFAEFFMYLKKLSPLLLSLRLALSFLLFLTALFLLAPGLLFLLLRRRSCRIGLSLLRPEKTATTQRV